MGWFDEQVKERAKNDDDLFASAFAGMANILNNKNKKATVSFQHDRDLSGRALQEILRYYSVRAREVPPGLEEEMEILEYLLRPSGIMYREIELTGDWFRDASGPMLAKTLEGRPIALLPGPMTGYVWKNPATGEEGRVDRAFAATLAEEAVCFYRPFPMRSMDVRDLIAYIFSLLRARDYALIIGLTAVTVLVGLITPAMTSRLYQTVLGNASHTLLWMTLLTMLCASVSSFLFGAARSIVNANVTMRMNMEVESSTMMRVLSLPPAFFKEYAAGELAGRISYMSVVCSEITEMIFSSGLTALFSLVYIGQVVYYTPFLGGVAMAITILTLVISVGFSLMQIRISRAQMLEATKESGLTYALFGGIQKIRSAGAEKRAFAKWADQYAKSAKYLYDPPFVLKMSGVITTLVSMAGTLIMYAITLDTHVQLSDYMAFSSAYGMVSGAFSAMAGIIVSAASIQPIMEMIEPIMKAQPEISEDRKPVTKLAGDIELSNIWFRYDDNLPYVLQDLSLRIKKGEYVAIVGTTGCGKSTLLRLLLGFEKPQRGTVFFDGRDLRTLDVKSLRRRIGVVMQNGRLFYGDIFSNIAVTAGRITLEDAWDAMIAAGMEEDLQHMPMGMGTIISDGAGGISGGQRQRILIARALASKPSILMFDEATSALDNVTQKIVSDTLESLTCTRIVIAHRLSTIKACDRIIVLDKGRILEDGNYEELIAKGGFFAELVERQRA